MALCGCGKKDAAGAGTVGAVEFETKNLEAISDAYRDDPGGSDAKYTGKVGRVPFNGNFVHENGKLVGKFTREGVVRSAHQPDLLFRFASDAEAAKVDKRKGYYLIGRCEGLKDNVVLFSNCRADGEYPPPIQ
jgi:hypothetical protein